MKIEIIGKFYDNHSFSLVNRQLVSELYKLQQSLGFELFILPLDKFDASMKIEPKHLVTLKELEKKQIAEGQEADIQIRHSYPPVWKYPISKNTRVIYIQPWEYSKILLEWQYKFETFADAVIAPSNWNINNYLDSGLNPDRAYSLPWGYDQEIFNTDNRPDVDRKFTFTFVGNAQYRKGLDILLNVWKDVFKKADKAKLIIKDSPLIYGENSVLESIINMQYKTKCGTIEYIDKNLSTQEMSNLFKNTDVIVHPHRGEGFGMHIQEAMACGAIPLVPNVGSTEFVSEECGEFIHTNKTYIDITAPQIVAHRPGDAFTKAHQYADINEVDPRDLAGKLIMLYRLQNSDKMIDKRKNLTKNLRNWNQCANHLIEICKQVMSMPIVRK